jgi:hypothetical protein
VQEAFQKTKCLGTQDIAGFGANKREKVVDFYDEV